MQDGQQGPALETDGEPGDDLEQVRRVAEGCTHCDLYRDATHLVFGKGPGHAEVVLVGEQPGDKEDPAARHRPSRSRDDPPFRPSSNDEPAECRAGPAALHRRSSQDRKIPSVTQVRTIS